MKQPFVAVIFFFSLFALGATVDVNEYTVVSDGNDNKAVEKFLAPKNDDAAALAPVEKLGPVSALVNFDVTSKNGPVCARLTNHPLRIGRSYTADFEMMFFCVSTNGYDMSSMSEVSMDPAGVTNLGNSITFEPKAWAISSWEPKFGILKLKGKASGNISMNPFSPAYRDTVTVPLTVMFPSKDAKVHPAKVQLDLLVRAVEFSRHPSPKDKFYCSNTVSDVIEAHHGDANKHYVVEFPCQTLPEHVGNFTYSSRHSSDMSTKVVIHSDAKKGVIRADVYVTVSKQDVEDFWFHPIDITIHPPPPIMDQTLTVPLYLPPPPAPVLNPKDAKHEPVFVVKDDEIVIAGNHPTHADQADVVEVHDGVVIDAKSGANSKYGFSLFVTALVLGVSSLF